jgi:DNA-binding NarL/FixJ family response regulator
MTMKEIGATLDLSESRVSQMHSSIVARLKAQMNSRKKEFVVACFTIYLLVIHVYPHCYV